jgi:predicted AAA+ superfamily ATPase
MISRQVLKDILVSNEEYILKHVKKIIKREGVFSPRTLNKTVVFYGVRRSGKTFILFDLFKKNINNSVYADFEDDRLLEFKLGDFERLKEAVLELKPHLIGKEIIFLLDEVQNIKGWEKFCRRAVERENINVYVSGSSSKIMPSEIHTELRGRVWSVEILPFSFREYLFSKGVDPAIRDILYGHQKAVVKNHFSEYIRWGGFPEVSFLESEFEKTKLLKEYLSAMFFRDLAERYEITNIPLLEALMDKLFSSFSMKFSLTSFYKQYKEKFPFSKDLLFRYYKYFLQSMLIFEVRKFAESVYKRMRNPAKVFLVDIGICKRITSQNAGRLLENVVFLELRRRGFDAFYFEEKRECDFIAMKDNKLFPVQVSYEMNDENRKRETDGLIEACKWLNIKEGAIITYDEEKEMELDGISIKVLPAWKWLIQG